MQGTDWGLMFSYDTLWIYLHLFVSHMDFWLLPGQKQQQLGCMSDRVFCFLHSFRSGAALCIIGEGLGVWPVWAIDGGRRRLRFQPRNRAHALGGCNLTGVPQISSLIEGKYRSSFHNSATVYWVHATILHECWPQERFITLIFTYQRRTNGIEAVRSSRVVMWAPETLIYRNYEHIL